MNTKAKADPEIARLERVVNPVRQLSPAGKMWLADRLVHVELREAVRG